MTKSRPTRNEKLDALIAELHDALAPAEAELEQSAEGRGLPLVLIVGAPRGGTTLLLQWLAASGAFAYPTNLLARLSRAPAIGARLQQLFTNPEFDFDGDLFDLRSEVGFSSNLGKTKGALAPNEFWFFWRRFLPTSTIRALGPEGVAETDTEGLRAALASLEDVFDKPFAMKGLMVQFDLAAFAEVLPNAFFLHVVRDPVYNAQSLLESRERYFGSRDAWYSVEPANVDELKALPPEEQVIGQVAATHAAVREGRAAIDPGRSLEVDYEAFCDDPAALWSALRAKLGALGHELPEAHPGPTRFDVTNVDRLDAATMARLRELAGD
jgi:hypothetical protein